MKKLLLALSLTAICLGLESGCGQKQSADATPDKPAKHAIAVIPKGLAHIYWQTVRAGAKAACDEFGYDMFWNGPERETDRERQIQIVEDFMVQKVDGIVLAPLDRKTLVPTLEKLAAAKIPVAIVDSGIDSDNYVCFAATDNYQGGVLAARRMGKILDGKWLDFSVLSTISRGFAYSNLLLAFSLVAVGGGALYLWAFRKEVETNKVFVTEPAE